MRLAIQSGSALTALYSLSTLSAWELEAGGLGRILNFDVLKGFESLGKVQSKRAWQPSQT